MVCHGYEWNYCIKTALWYSKRLMSNVQLFMFLINHCPENRTSANVLLLMMRLVLALLISLSPSSSKNRSDDLGFDIGNITPRLLLDVQRTMMNVYLPYFHE